MINREQLTGKIGELVDVLRSDTERRVSMADIASITEVLITTMERYFGSIDTSIYREFQELSDRISNLRSEIARAQPKEIKAHRIPRAGKELDEVVRATEEATNTIMEAAEEIMSADTSDPATYQEKVNDACMKIFEACSFQDITGQRVTKVITTLSFIEERLGAILTAWNPSDEELGAGGPRQSRATRLCSTDRRWPARASTRIKSTQCWPAPTRSRRRPRRALPIHHRHRHQRSPWPRLWRPSPPRPKLPNSPKPNRSKVTRHC